MIRGYSLDELLGSRQILDKYGLISDPDQENSALTI